MAIANGASYGPTPHSRPTGHHDLGLGRDQCQLRRQRCRRPGFSVKGQVSGGTLIKSGTGIVTLANVKNTQSATQINQGALAVSADGDLGPSTSSVTIDAGAVLRVTDSFTTVAPINDSESRQARRSMF